jgi:hypothetical protein
MSRRAWILAAGVAAAVVVIILLAGGGGVPGGGPTRLYGTTLADPVPYDGRSPAIAPQEEERVLVELPRPALGASAARVKASGRRQQAYVESLRAESEALVSALRARDVRLRDVVTFERCWHGFAATIRERDLSQLQSLGLRVRANRRFFPSFSQPVPAPGPPTPAPTGPKVTLLAGGVTGAEPGGYDAFDGDDRPLPGTDLREPQRREVGGDPLAAALRALGATVRVVRVSGLADGEEFARTDTLLAGLERTVDPDGDGDTSDHDGVALVGVSAPYAGFADAPEAVAVRAADRIGTVVVAPSGAEGKATGAYGTIGSPGASAGALAVAPLSSPALVARSTLRVGNTTVTGAAVLAGTPPTGELTTARPPDANTTAALLVASDELTDKLAIVQAGANPGARAAAAAGAGAAAVVVAEPRDGRPLPTLAAGRVSVPVLGVGGPAARAILALEPGTTAEATGLEAPKPPFTSGTLSRFASVGPAYDGTPKPDLTRPGSIIAGGELISGPAVAAARVAVDAARGLDVAPEPDTEEPPAPAPPSVPVTGLAVDHSDRATSVQFTVGSFSRSDDGTAILPAARLELTLTKEGEEEVIERLTPPGGERGVLPGAYAFTVPRPVIKALAEGKYVFRVSARAPRQTEATTAVSPPFTK